MKIINAVKNGKEILTMKIKLTVIATALSAAVAAPAFAHGGFAGSLGTGVKKDILRGVCPTGTSPAVTSAQAQILDKAPVNAPIVKVQIKKVSANNCTSSVTASGAIRQDNVDGDANYSALSSVAGGNGTAFRIEIFKTETGGAAESYDLGYHCENGTANHPVPTLAYCQNQ
jgi:hypothetical protein